MKMNNKNEEKKIGEEKLKRDNDKKQVLLRKNISTMDMETGFIEEDFQEDEE